MSLPVFLAPMEGVTDHVYRRVHHAHFTGVDKYFIPFISPTQDLCLTNRERRDVSPANNAGLFAVPQVLTKNVEYFLWAARRSTSTSAALRARSPARARAQAFCSTCRRWKSSLTRFLPARR